MKHFSNLDEFYFMYYHFLCYLAREKVEFFCNMFC